MGILNVHTLYKYSSRYKRENKDESSFNSRNINVPGCCNLSLLKKIAEIALKFNIDGKIRGLRL